MTFENKKIKKVTKLIKPLKLVTTMYLADISSLQCTSPSQRVFNQCEIIIWDCGNYVCFFFLFLL